MGVELCHADRDPARQRGGAGIDYLAIGSCCHLPLLAGCRQGHSHNNGDSADLQRGGSRTELLVIINAPAKLQGEEGR